MLRDLAYYKTGGSCDALHRPSTQDELASVVKDIHKSKTAVFILGGGTNSLVSDEHWQGAVISLDRMQTIRTIDSEFALLVEAGVENTQLARKALELSWSGLAWMNRLPGQLGGTIRMNARCYGGEISQIVKEVYAVSKSGEIKTYVNRDQDLFKGYKDTIFMGNGDIITGAKLSLAPGEQDKISSFMESCAADRMSKGQFLFPSCGCVFKNDYAAGVPSGMLIERAGGYKLNQENIILNPKHANFVFNKGASSREILLFTLAMRDLVYEWFGVWLSYEMEILGTLPSDLKNRLKQIKAPNFNEKLIALRHEFQKSRSPSTQT